MQLERCRKCASMIRGTRDSNQEIGDMMFQKKKDERKILLNSQLQKEIFEDGSYTGKGKIIRSTALVQEDRGSVEWKDSSPRYARSE